MHHWPNYDPNLDWERNVNRFLNRKNLRLSDLPASRQHSPIHPSTPSFGSDGYVPRFTNVGIRSRLSPTNPTPRKLTKEEQARSDSKLSLLALIKKMPAIQHDTVKKRSVRLRRRVTFKDLVHKANTTSHTFENRRGELKIPSSPYGRLGLMSPKHVRGSGLNSPQQRSFSYRSIRFEPILSQGAVDK
jgi:hypothetical protein